MQKLANIIPILKPNRNNNLGTSYRPTSLLSPLAKTLEKTILPYITNKILYINTQHSYKRIFSTDNHCKLDMSKAFDAVNIHKFISKLMHTNITLLLISYTHKEVFFHPHSSTYRSSHVKTSQLHFSKCLGET